MIATENSKPVHWTQMRYRVKPTRYKGLRLCGDRADGSWRILRTDDVTTVVSPVYTSEAEAVGMVGQIRNNLVARGRRS